MTTIRCPLCEASQISPHEPAIISDERIIRYYELDEMASRVAGHLTELGLTAGERVALYLPADWRSIALYLGLLRAGATACFINTRLPRAAVLAPDPPTRVVGAVISYLQDPGVRTWPGYKFIILRCCWRHASWLPEIAPGKWISINPPPSCSPRAARASPSPPC